MIDFIVRVICIPQIPGIYGLINRCPNQKVKTSLANVAHTINLIVSLASLGSMAFSLYTIGAIGIISLKDRKKPRVGEQEKNLFNLTIGLFVVNKILSQLTAGTSSVGINRALGYISAIQIK